MKRLVPFVRAIIFALLLIPVSYSSSYSQSITTGNGKLEVGVGLGPLVFLGDLGGSAGIGRTFIKDIDYPLIKLNKGLFINIAPTEWLGFRLGINQGVIEGDDKKAPNKGGAEVSRLQRNLSFKSNLLEVYAGIEFYPTVFLEQYEELQGKLRPYGVVGVGVFRFNPKTKTDNGQWVELKPLHTEGQGFPEFPDRKEYSLTQLEIPMGFGLKYYMKENMYIGFEVLHRKTFTDYMDDVSTRYIDPIYFDAYLPPAQADLARQLNYRGTYQWAQTNPGAVVGEIRGHPEENDAFFSTLLRMGWRLNSTPAGARQLRCPRFY